jgi:hypothetical protein
MRRVSDSMPRSFACAPVAMISVSVVRRALGERERERPLARDRQRSRPPDRYLRPEALGLLSEELHQLGALDPRRKSG